MSDILREAIKNIRKDEALAITQELLNQGKDPLQLIEACRLAMEDVGKLYENGEYFLPELMMSGEILKQINALTKPLIGTKDATKRLGKVVIGTVKGDIHDIGKNIVTFLLDINGFQVYDLGVDVPAERLLEKVKEVKA